MTALLHPLAKFSQSRHRRTWFGITFEEQLHSLSQFRLFGIGMHRQERLTTLVFHDSDVMDTHLVTAIESNQ